jgi:hypothetical protein
MAITGWREFPAFVWGDGPLRPGIGWGELSASGGGAGRAVCGGAELHAALAAVAWAPEDEG